MNGGIAMRGFAAVSLVAFIGHSVYGQVQYNVTDLGTLPGYNNSYGTAINSSGQVVGVANSSSGTAQAFIYSNGKMTGLGMLPGLTMSWAYGINDSGQVVGGSSTSTGQAQEAFLYANGTMTGLTFGSSASWAYGINNNGQVVGEAEYNPGNEPVLYSSGKVTGLGTIGGQLGEAYAINASGIAVGTAATTSQVPMTYDAFLSNGTMTDLGSLGSGGSQANAINATGEVVGLCGMAYTSHSAISHAFLYSGGKMTDLGVLAGLGIPSQESSAAFGINDSGQVVGVAGSAFGITFTSPGMADSADHAFIYSNGLMTDLNSLISPGWTLEEATAINNAGDIVGVGVNPQGASDAFLLTPVPEPSTLVLLTIGAVSLLAYAWRRRRPA
jgi:probable HAF family extracellular repeat protein